MKINEAMALGDNVDRTAVTVAGIQRVREKEVSGMTSV